MLLIDLWEKALDNTTNQYNEDMKKVLPLFGINVIEIERKKLESETFISATKVREGIRNGNIVEVKEMLPFTTIRYLKQKGFLA